MLNFYKYKKLSTPERAAIIGGIFVVLAALITSMPPIYSNFIKKNSKTLSTQKGPEITVSEDLEKENSISTSDKIEQKVAEKPIGSKMVIQQNANRSEKKETKFSSLWSSAHNGNSGAQFQLGEIFINQNDYKNAVKWFNKSAEQGHLEAKFMLAAIYSEAPLPIFDIDKSISIYREIASQGHINAALNLGLMFFNGWKDVNPNSEEAANWLTLASDGGESSASVHLGELFECGISAPLNREIATQFYEKAVKQGGYWGSQAKKRLYNTYDPLLPIAKNDNIKPNSITDVVVFWSPDCERLKKRFSEPH